MNLYSHLYPQLFWMSVDAFDQKTNKKATFLAILIRLWMSVVDKVALPRGFEPLLPA